jgi:hypothetical protein
MNPRLALLLLCSQVLSPAQDAGRTLSELYAFAARDVAGKPEVACPAIASQATCSSLAMPQVQTYGLLVCSCASRNPARFEREVARFARRFSLLQIAVREIPNGWVIATRDVKLLPAAGGSREPVLAKLRSTAFVLSAADRGSPYRIFVRRRDGKAPSTADVDNLKTTLGVDAEVETIVITTKGKELSR